MEISIILLLKLHASVFFFCTFAFPLHIHVSYLTCEGLWTRVPQIIQHMTVSYTTQRGGSPWKNQYIFLEDWTLHRLRKSRSIHQKLMRKRNPRMVKTAFPTLYKQGIDQQKKRTTKWMPSATGKWRVLAVDSCHTSALRPAIKIISITNKMKRHK